MTTLIRTDSENPAFKSLVKELDSYLKITDGDEHDFYNQFNNIDVLKNIVIACKNNNPVGCGAFKKFNSTSIEIKRMYVVPEYRQEGIAAQVLLELEKWATKLGYTFSILETGKRQVEAVNFYKKNGYNIIPNFGQYINMENSLCFKKELN